jgi:hypothetical protein
MDHENEKAAHLGGGDGRWEAAILDELLRQGAPRPTATAGAVYPQ